MTTSSDVPDYDAWANETPEPTPAPSDAEVLRKFLDTGALDYDVVGYNLTYGHLRGVLRERDQLTNALRVEKLRCASAEKLFAAAETEARSLRALRDSMEGALNKANTELHTITRCGETTIGLLGYELRPCMRQSGHPGGHRNADGTEWRERLPLEDPPGALQLIDPATGRTSPLTAYPRPDWLIWSHEHAGWWKPFEQGYTTILAEAGRYLHARAYQICREANGYEYDGGPSEVMIEYTDDPQTAATAVREATAEWTADRETTGE